MTVLDVTEAGCLGVAILAKAHATGEKVGEISTRWVKPLSKTMPSGTDFYNEKFRSYKQLYPSLKKFY